MRIRGREVPPAAVVAGLLLFFVVAGWLSLRGDSATSDETAHVGAGVSCLDTRDLRMNPEHPPLAKGWAALLPWALSRTKPDYSGEAWRSADQWLFGFELLNGPLRDPARRDPRAVLLPARGMMLVLGVALGLVVWAWSRRIWGEAGALVSLALFVLSPTMLAHARLVTTDLPAALGFTAAAWLFREALGRPSAARIAAAGAALAAALLFKFSAVLLGPILLLAGGLFVAFGDGETGRATDRRRRFRTVLLVLLGAGVVAWVGVWAGYGFRWAATGGGYSLPWAFREGLPGGLSPLVLSARDARILPEAWVFGLGAALQDQVRLAYFHGEISPLGFRAYFPVAFALKTPPALVALSIAAIAGGAALWKRRRVDAIVLLSLFVVYAGTALASRLNLGHRHLAPLEPVLFIACGAIPALADRPWKRIAAGLLVAGCVASWVAATPGYLSYFNFLAGGARGGARWLLDSNLDWGQDLARLAHWMERENVDRIHLAYFGTADPQAYGIRYDKVVFYSDFRPWEPTVRPGPGDLFAVSANLLHGLYLNHDRDLADALAARRLLPGRRVREYAAMREALVQARRPYPKLAEWVVAEGIATEAQVEEAEAGLLSTWMARLRTTSRPIAYAGDSIWIYRIGEPLPGAARP